MPNNTLPREVSGFKKTDLEPDREGLKETQKQNRKLIELNIQDIQWRLTTRKRFGWIILILLLCQNIAVFILVFVAYFRGDLDKLAIVFSVLVSATLGETVLVVKIIIEWLFRDINYSISNKSDNGKQMK